MGLPIAEHVTFDLTIPKSGKKLKFRPMVMREYKPLLTSIAIEDSDAIMNAIKNIVESCTFGKFDVEKAPMYELDYIFLMIKAKSSGELVPAQYKCNNEVERDGVVEPCGKVSNLNLNIGDIDIFIPPKYDDGTVIRITDKIGLKLKAPTFEEFRKTIVNKSDMESLWLYSCIECVFDGEQILIPEKDFFIADLEEFMDSLKEIDIDNINHFFDNLPFVYLEIPFKCPHCGHTETVILKGLDDFFV